MFPNPFASLISKYNIRWLFDDSLKTKLEELLSVDFVQTNHYYSLMNDNYTYIELLLGLNELNFTLHKTENIVEIIIKSV